MATVLDLMGKWLVEGRRGYQLKKINRLGFRLGSEARVNHFVYQNRHIVEIPTDGGFSLLVTRPTVGVTGWNMLIDWSQIIYDMKPTGGNGVVLSSAQVDESAIDISDLRGMREIKGDWVIQQAKMAAMFSLSYQKISVKSAVAISALRGGNVDPQKGDYIADHDLYAAVCKPGHILPLAAAFVPANELK
jgi:hypothetical protein